MSTTPRALAVTPRPPESPQSRVTLLAMDVYAALQREGGIPPSIRRIKDEMRRIVGLGFEPDAGLQGSDWLDLYRSLEWAPSTTETGGLVTDSEDKQLFTKQ